MIKKIDTSEKNLSQLIGYSIGKPTIEKNNKILSSYEKSGNILGFFSDKTLVGFVAYSSDHRVILQHLSVLPEHRGKGIARKLIEHLISHLRGCSIEAETDDDAVNFYRKLGFHCKPIESKWETKRYLCIFSRNIDE